MSVESRRVCTVKGKDSVHLWVNVSPTLGVVDCGSFVCPEAQSITHIYAAFSDVGARSDDSLLIGMNANWLFLYFDEGLYLWRLADGCLTKEESDGRLVGRLGLSEVGALWLFFGGNLLHSDLNKAILMKGNEVSSEILFVDLLRTFESKTLVIDKVLSTPPAAFDSIWINNTLHTVHLVMESPSMVYVFNTNTKETLHTFSFPSSYHQSLGPHHLCLVDKCEVMSVFHSSDLTTPCCVHHLPIHLQPANCGFVPVAVPAPTTDTENATNHTRVVLCDTISGIALASLHCQP